MVIAIARVIPKHKIGLFSKWAAQPRNDTSAEEKRRNAEAWQALNEYITRQGAFVVTPPGKLLRIEIPKDPDLPAKLIELGYAVRHAGTGTRLTYDGVVAVNAIEISLDGK